MTEREALVLMAFLGGTTFDSFQLAIKRADSVNCISELGQMSEQNKNFNVIVSDENFTLQTLAALISVF